MTRVSLIRETGRGNEYHQILVLGNNTPYQILLENSIDPDSCVVYLNGRQLNDNDWNEPLNKFGQRETTVFLFVRKQI